MGDTPSELEGWDGIINLAGVDNEPSRAKASMHAQQKQVLAMANLANAVFDAQSHISGRLDTLNKHINEANKSTTELSRAANSLTKAIAIATAAGVLVAAVGVIITALK